MKSKLQEKNLYVLELPYKIIYFIFAFFTFCNLTFMRPVMKIAVFLVLFMAVLVAIPRLYNMKGFLKMPGIIFAVGFLASYAVSAIANYKYGYSDNFKNFIWMGLHFSTIFACDLNRDEKEYKKEFKVISIFFMAVMFVMSTVSIVMLMMNYSVIEYLDTYVHLVGVVWGRLWGFFTDPNYGSVFSVITIVFSIYFFRNTKNIYAKIALVINAIIQVLYMAFSDSRTGLVALFACIVMYVILIGIKKFKFKTAVNVTVSILLAVVIGGLSVVCVTVTKDTCNVLIEKKYEQSEIPKEDIPVIKDEDREEILKEDISNRRFDLWKSGIEIWQKSPIIGVSFFNMDEYASEEMPDTYLVNNGVGKFSNMHNIIINILVGQGALGIAIFLAFAIYAVVYILKRMFKYENEDYEYLVILVVGMIGSFVGSMFVTDVIYTNSPTSLVFWLFLGYTLHFLKRREKETAKE